MIAQNCSIGFIRKVYFQQYKCYSVCCNDLVQKFDLQPSFEIAKKFNALLTATVCTAPFINPFQSIGKNPHYFFLHFDRKLNKKSPSEAMQRWSSG